MTTTHTTRSQLRSLLAALVVLVFLAANANAESIVVRNRTKSPVVVQAACLMNGRLVRDRPHLLQPGGASPAIPLRGDMLIKIYDARMPNFILYQGAIPSDSNDREYDIVVGKTPKVKLRRQSPLVTRTSR